MNFLKQKNGFRFFCIMIFVVISPYISFSAGIKKPEKSVSAELEAMAESLMFELHVTPDGTYGVDSSGEEWEYDYSKGEFEKDPGKLTATRFGRKDESADDHLEHLDEALLDSRILNDEMDDVDEKFRLLELELKEHEKEARRLTGLKIGTVIIEDDENIRGPIFAIGEVIVRGKVIGDVISYKRITVTSTGQITGNATAPDIVKMRGGRILGKRMEDFPTINIPDMDIFGREISYIPLIVHLSIFGGLLLVGLLVLLVAPKPVSRIKNCLQISFVKSFFLGFLFWIAVGPLMALLSLTIIGIPIAVIALPIAILLAILLGGIGTAQLAGKKLISLIKVGGSSGIIHFLSGLIILYCFWFFWALFFIKPDSASQGFATFCLVMSIVIWSIIICTGIGAVILTRFGSRECRKGISVNIHVHPSPAPPPPTPPPLNKDEEEL